ncbi:MAG: ATP-dependent DNA ligase [Chloroflexi bacterium]|nr:ATP-dependent DNA ligase [Chloroflexota bacterium]
MPEWPFQPPRKPMEALADARFPEPPGWAYEPKWDGFRALAWSAGADGEPRLDSRNERPLLRYFPELRGALDALPAGTVVDGEIVVVTGDVTDFDALQQRIHPAESRIERLSAETPAQLVAFDLLAIDGEDLRAEPFETRRARLEALLGGLDAPWSLTPSTHDLATAEEWHARFEAAGCDGIVAKRLDGRYVEGKRDMVKIKHRHTIDAVVGGYRVHKEGDRIGSLLLGMYDADGAMHFVGHISGFPDEERVALLARFEALRADASFGEDARQPGMESRWSQRRESGFVPVRPEVVVEASYDQTTGGRLRHAARFERWRPDKQPEECTLDGLGRPEGAGFGDVLAEARRDA